MEKPAWRNFGEAIGQIGSRYSQLAPGARSSQRSSGFQNAQTAAASQFAENLAARRQELQRQAIQDLLQSSHMLLGERPYETMFFEEQQKEPSFWEKLLGGIGGIAGQISGTAASGLGRRLTGGFR